MPSVPVVLAALVLSLGCESGGAEMTSTPPVSLPAYEPVVNVKQTMEWILDPAADVIWDSAGWVITAEGETDLAPTTDEAWADVRNSAAIVAETGNLLLMPGRTAGANWIAWAQSLTVAGEVAMAAAEAHDADALFDAGGQLYQVCRACHQRYLVPLEEARRSR